MKKVLPKPGVRDTRAKVLMVRFTEAEYRQVLVASAAARSLSDHARIVLLADAQKNEARPE
jgi:hypothetical protein